MYSVVNKTYYYYYVKKNLINGDDHGKTYILVIQYRMTIITDKEQSNEFA